MDLEFFSKEINKIMVSGLPPKYVKINELEGVDKENMGRYIRWANEYSNDFRKQTNDFIEKIEEFINKIN